jgi:hypothetical protein
MGHQNNQEKVTLENLYAYLHESSKEFKEEAKKRDEEAKKRAKEFNEELKETSKEFKQMARDADHRMKETDRQLKEAMEEHSRQLKEAMQEDTRQLNESIKETDRQLKESIRETDRQLKEAMEKTDEKIHEVSRQLGCIGNSNGDMAEEYFQSAFTKNPSLNGEMYDAVRFNVNPMIKKGQKGSEYDIVLANGKSIAIIEIKYYLKKNDVKDALSKALNQVETFKKFYPEYANYKFYLGMASLSFGKSVEDIIQKAGIAVIKQVGDKMVVNSENLKVF